MRGREQHTAKIIEIASACSDYGFTRAEEIELEGILGAYSDEMVDRIYRLVTQRRNTVIRKRDDNLTNLNLIILSAPSETRLREFLHFAPKLNTHLGFSYTMISGLKHVEGLEKHEDYSIASDEVQSQCLTLIRITTAMMSSAKNPPISQTGDNPSFPERHIDDPRITAMILDHPELESKIIEAIHDSERGDFGLIDAVVNGSNIPLSVGIL